MNLFGLCLSKNNCDLIQEMNVLFNDKIDKFQLHLWLK